MYENVAYYLLSTIIQSLAALMAISFIVNDYINRKVEQLYFDLFQLADIWWQRDNATVGQVNKPDIKRRTTVDGAPEFLKRNMDSISQHKDIYDETVKKIHRLEMMEKNSPKLFKCSLVISFLVILLSSFALILTACWSKFSWFGFILLALTLFFLGAVFLFVFMIYQVIGDKIRKKEKGIK